MSKRPNLAAVAAAAGSTRRSDTGPIPAAAPREVREQATTTKTRVGTKQIAAHFPEDVAWQLRALAVEHKTTVQNLMAEALNDLFAKHGKPEVAPMDRGRGGLS